MLSLSEMFRLDLAESGSDRADRVLADLREVIADPLFGNEGPGLIELKTLAASAPDTAQAMLRLDDAYRRANERLASADAAMAGGSGGGAQTSYEEVRDFFHYAGNYIDRLDVAAEALAMRLGPDRQGRLGRLVGHIEARHGLKVSFALPEHGEEMRRYDRAEGTIHVNARLPTSTLYFQLAVQLALVAEGAAIDEIVAGAGFDGGGGGDLPAGAGELLRGRAAVALMARFSKRQHAAATISSNWASPSALRSNRSGTGFPQCSGQRRAVYRSSSRGWMRRARSPSGTRRRRCSFHASGRLPPWNAASRLRGAWADHQAIGRDADGNRCLVPRVERGETQRLVSRAGQALRLCARLRDYAREPADLCSRSRPAAGSACRAHRGFVSHPPARQLRATLGAAAQRSARDRYRPAQRGALSAEMSIRTRNAPTLPAGASCPFAQLVAT